ncbi:phytase [Sphingomonas carotinifaciens]|uniref:Phytase n=1 Tax=Sphingomonas carotinifaciens TaxID=1166323 RepID=A0A1G7G6K7_9SPHN|nr:phytase [Sphingomonas carotinifaciens]MBB4086408.1 3-phytase [Sphingomonas carotinifaciens]MWC42727.1 phytase [Sphingomonas carotinifaciens]SDE83758.1 3-phytase [Sphingomonas carotinifaciens]
MRALLLAGLLAGCATVPPASDVAPNVPATAETDPVDTAADAADDPAIWRNAADPAKSLVIGTDKKAGIHVYDMKGKRLSFTPAARLNNVDLRDLGGRVVVAASDRADVATAHVSLFLLDTAAARLQPLGRYPVGAGEAYGMCLWTRASDKALFGFVVLKDGRIDQVAIDTAGATPQVKTVRSMKVATQAEGCVVDDRTGLLYVAEEDVGLWRFAADPAAPVTGTPIAQVDGRTLFADAEGLALAPQGRNGGYLVASSQGDNAYTLYRLPGVTYAGRFRIDGGAIDGTSETDGIELALGDFGPDYPRGLFVAQDGDNAPDTQNFKYVSWEKILKALGL